MSAASATTAAVLTPTGRGAVAVISIDGAEGVKLVERFFQSRGSKKFGDYPPERIVYGRWGGQPAEDVIACRRGAARFEIHCHGGSAATERILADLAGAGATIIPWSEWIPRDEASPLRTAARTALAQATTERAALVLLDQFHGALERELQRIVSLIESADLTQAAGRLQQLLARAPLGLHLTQPWRVVIAGPPNVGKSSLLNALLGYQRAIVFDQPGTTRDVVTATTALDGWPVQLSDTAGWRVSDDALESAGVELARQQASAADCLVLVFDSTQCWTAEQQALRDGWPRVITIANKADLPRAPDFPSDIILHTSALTGAGIEELINIIVAQLVPEVPAPDAPTPFHATQVEQLRLADKALKKKELTAASAILLALLAKG